jgi:hypothetical protein
VPLPICRYRVSTHYLWAGVAALGLAAFSGWVAWHWPVAWIAAGLSLASAAVVLFLGLQPPIEIFESHVQIGRRTVPWTQIRRLDRSSRTPLVVQLTLADKARIVLVYAGDIESATSLLRHLRRMAREALIDGVPYRQFWGESLNAGTERKQLPPPRRPLLLADDEAEVERLFQRLKTVGHLDQKTSSEDK